MFDFFIYFTIVMDYGYFTLYGMLAQRVHVIGKYKGELLISFVWIVS